jgi:hypothetical protein
MDFKEFITEAPERTAAFAFGRFNPPTVGHEKLITKVKDTAKEHGATAHIVTSHSEGTAKDPVPQKAKIGYLKKVAGKGPKVSGSSKEAPSVLDAATNLHKQGYNHLVMVAGSDRVDEYHKLLHKYNNVPGKHGHYNFKSIKVVSAGQRDPDAEGVEGMSGTKMRAHARAGEMDKFKSGLPTALHPHAEEIANHIKSVKEDFENPYRHDWGTPEGTLYMQKMTPGEDKKMCPTGSIWSATKVKCVPIREAYHASEIFNIGTVVESKTGELGEVVYRGSSYVTLVLESGNTKKYWINDIQESNKVLKIKEFVRKYDVVETKDLRKIPALLMSKEQLIERNNQSMEVEYNGYNTQNLHICESASKQLKDLIATSKANSKYILQAIQATDNYLGIEKEAIKAGFADDKMVHDFNMYMAIAHDTLNMLGYGDETLSYMKKHVAAIGKLSLHKDGTMANETGSTVPVFGQGDVAEGVNAANFRMVSRAGPDGKERWVKQRNTSIIRDTKVDQMKDIDKDGIPNDSEGQLPSTKKALSSLRRSLGVPVKETYLPDPPTATRDINASPNKEVYHGIDIPIADQGYPDKPLGLASFKSYLSTPQTNKIEADKSKEMNAVHRDKAELGTHSPTYKQMVKAHAQE